MTVMEQHGNWIFESKWKNEKMEVEEVIKANQQSLVFL
jgi:hypothetical protein